MDPVSVAKAYVGASNAHDLDAVEALLADGALYISTGVGEHIGRGAIRAMMDVFFSGHNSLNWQTSGWTEEQDGSVAFDFVMTGIGAKSGEKIEKTGREFIWVGQDGFIERIEVRA